MKDVKHRITKERDPESSLWFQGALVALFFFAALGIVRANEQRLATDVCRAPRAGERLVMNGPGSNEATCTYVTHYNYAEVEQIHSEAAR